MKIKCYFRRNLKLSPEKLAAQVGHVCKELGKLRPDSIWNEDAIIVLKLSDTKFFEMIDQLETTGKEYHLQIDNGHTEVEPNTPTVVGFIEEE